MIISVILIIVSCIFFLLPIPIFIIDLALIGIIVLSFTILTTTLTSKSQQDFYGFPNLLILITVARLSLNAACARTILVSDHNSLYPAGKVINLFAQVIAANNIAVGLVIFLLIMIVNFIVIIRGSSRIAEVHARFALDSLPGKQVAIDAELNSNNISNEEAHFKRQKLQKEIEFYGSMDGAAKFAHGEAIASILITIVNLIAGIAIGIIQHKISAYDAIIAYGQLSIGEGLITQICSLLLATSLGIIVSGSQNYFIFNYDIFAIIPYILGCLSVVPGLPNLSLMLLAIIVYTLSPEPAFLQKEDNVLHILISKNLIDVFSLSKCEEVFAKIINNIAKENGILLNNFKIITDNESSNSIEILFSDVRLDFCTIYLDKFLSFEKHENSIEFSVFQKMYWSNIKTEKSLDPFAVVCMSIKHILQNNLHEMFQLEDLYVKIENLRPEYQRLLKNILQHLKITDIKNLLIQLVRERISISRFEVIIEALDATCSSRQLDVILNHIRLRLSRYICEQYINKQDKKLYIYQLNNSWILFCKKYVNSNIVSLGHNNDSAFLNAIDEISFRHQAVLVVPTDTRKILSNILFTSGRFFPILSYGEIPQGADKVKDLGELDLPRPLENDII